MSFFSFALFSGLATAVSGKTDWIVHEAPALPHDWLPSDAAVPDDELVAFRFSVREQNLDELRRIAGQVSDPRSSKYGQYLSAKDINELTKPADADVALMQEWLDARDVPYTRSGTNGFEVRLPVSKAKALLHTDFNHVENVVTKQQVMRASSYSLPKDVDAVVAAVYGLHGLPLPRRAIRKPPAGPANVTPDVLAETYNVSGVTPSGSTTNRQAVAEFQDQTMMPSDLRKFFEKYVHGSKASSIHKFVGDRGVGAAGVEASLDVDYIMGAAPGILTEFWYYKSNDFCGDLVKWSSDILDTREPPLVHSVSYGWQGNLSQVGCKGSHVADVDANFAKLAARGISIIISSGDSGAGGGSACSDPSAQAKGTAITDGKLAYKFPGLPVSLCCQIAGTICGSKCSWTVAGGDECKVYFSVNGTKKDPDATSGGKAFPMPAANAKMYPSWPASSPWVTAVGATRFVDQKVGSLEMATDEFGSGGGFSRMFDAFKDQKDAVQHYFQTVNASAIPPATSFPAGGRATPDVSALGEGFQVIANGQVETVGGTSASAPTFAGFISLLNEVRTKAGKPAMGYLNPFLYQNAAAFRDVTLGSNAIGRQGEPLAYGWPCTSGWDPATGLGTPNFKKLLSLAMSAAGIEETVVV